VPTLNLALGLRVVIFMVGGSFCSWLDMKTTPWQIVMPVFSAAGNIQGYTYFAGSIGHRNLTATKKMAFN